jgi:hypothetical protein
MHMSFCILYSVSEARESRQAEDCEYFYGVRLCGGVPGKPSEKCGYSVTLVECESKESGVYPVVNALKIVGNPVETDLKNGWEILWRQSRNGG